MPERNYFVHPNAIVETDSIGKDTRIWAFAHVLKNVTIGEDCNICDHCFIENGVTVGNRVTMKNGIALWEGVTVEDDVFLGPFCVFTNDMFPRSKSHSHEWQKTLIKKGASVGANATILCGITLGEFSFIGAGSVVTKSVPDFALVTGNPARFRYWVSMLGEKLQFDNNSIAMDTSGTTYKLHSSNDSVLNNFVTIMK
jgi:acetyltransferase-like isoleucine patch superfamily enzyme